MNKITIISLTFVIILAVISRVFPHIPNVAPITALALYSGVYLGKRMAILLPLSIMLLADIFIGFHQTMIFVYGSFLVISLLGIWLSNRKSLINTLTVTILSSIIFFLVTNLGVWLEGRMYSLDIPGLIACYTMALPFFRYTLVGDLFFVGVFFGAHAVVHNLKWLRKEVDA